MIPPGPHEPYAGEDLFAWMKRNFDRYGEIYRASIFGSEIYVVNEPDFCARILRSNWQNYLRKGLVVRRIALALGNNLITSNGEDWVRQRRIMQPAFTKSAVERSFEMMFAVNVDLLERWTEAAKQHQTINVTRDVSMMVLKITLFSIFGDDTEDAAPHFQPFLDDARDLQFAELLRDLRTVIADIATHRQRHKIEATDTLGVMLQSSMQIDELAREVVNLVVAGHETTASALNWIWYLLATHPDAQTKLGSDLSYTRKVIDEGLRLYPPLWLMSRKAADGDQLGDYDVPAGTEIYMSPYLMGHNPRLWDASDRFDPARSSAGHELASCPFGAGPRRCIGELFARTEMQVHLMAVASRLRLHIEQQAQPEFEAAINLRMKHDLFLRPELRDG